MDCALLGLAEVISDTRYGITVIKAITVLKDAGTGFSSINRKLLVLISGLV